MSDALLRIFGWLVSMAIPFASIVGSSQSSAHVGVWKRALLAILLAIPILTAVPVVAAFVSGAALLMALRLATDH